MSLFDYFTDWATSTASILILTTTYDPTTGHTTTTFSDTGNTITGVKYNRSAAERYYSERFQPDVTDAFVTSYADIVTETDRLLIDSVTYSIESVLNIAEQDDVLLLGLKEFT